MAKFFKIASLIAVLLSIMAPQFGLPLAVLIAVPLLLLPAYPWLGYWNWNIIERLFPTASDMWLSGRGSYRPEAALRRRCWCVDRMCVGTDCNAWRWNRGIFDWRGMLTKRRGRCDTSAYRDVVVKKK